MKLTAKIAAAYWGAQVKHEGDTYKVFNSLREGYVNLWDSETCFLEDVSISYCQLILTPLDKISDEDAVEVAKIMGVIDTDCGVEDYEYWGNYVKKSYIHEGKSHRAFIVSVEVIDYLRSKGYDCGHGSIPSLIAAGVAVEKKEI